MKKQIQIGKTKKVYRLNKFKRRTKFLYKFTGKFGEHFVQNYLGPFFSFKFLLSKQFYFNSALSVLIISGAFFLLTNFKNTYNSFVAFAYDEESLVYREETMHFDTVLVKSEANQSNISSYLPSKVYSSVKAIDKRAYIFDLYFKENNSPLYGTGELFVKACDKYGAPKDCITTIAIARNESNLCKYPHSAEMFNCWGFGGGGSYRWTFTNFSESIDMVTNILVNQYGPQYMIDPSKMEKVFCGPTEECIGWGNDIKYFIEQIDVFSESKGFGRLTSLR